MSRPSLGQAIGGEKGDTSAAPPPLALVDPSLLREKEGRTATESFHCGWIYRLLCTLDWTEGNAAG